MIATRTRSFSLASALLAVALLGPACRVARDDAPSPGASAGGSGGSGGASGIANPSGNCPAPDNGARRGYSSPGAYTWIPDCMNVWRREYWRVYADSDHDSAILPRPDGDPGLSVPCSDPKHPLHDTVQRYRLCQAASSGDDLQYVNHLEVVDALAVTHFLNAHLVFVAAGTNVSPYAIPSDVLDACALHDNPPELDALCQQEQASVDSGDAIAWMFTEQGAAELAPRLNELYGIP